MDVGVAVYEAKYRRPFHSLGGLLLVVVVLGPLARGERLCGGQFEAVAMSLGFVKHVVQTILKNDVAIDAGASRFGEKQCLGFPLQVGKVLVAGEPPITTGGSSIR